MSTHDTDPLRSSLFAGSGDTTEPGPPPEATDTTSPDGDTDARLAASLLEDLAKAPLPTDGVRETEGHTAAAIAISAHRPPRAMDDGAAEPAVLLNTTEPFPMPPPAVVGAAAVGPKASPGAEGRRSAIQYSTVPSARVHRRQTVAVVIVIAIAVVAAASLIAFVPREATPPPAPVAVAPTSPAAPIATPAPILAATVTATVASASAPATSAAVVAPAVQAPVAAASVRAAATVPPAASAARPAVSAPRPARSSSGSFEEPDRNF